MRSKKVYVLLGALIASIFIGSAAYLNTNVSADTTATLGLDEGVKTSDADLVISAVASLADKEALPAQIANEWFYTSYSFYNPEENRAGATYSLSTDSEVSTKELIPERPLSESYIRFDSSGNIVESINIIRDERTGEITQLNVWDGEMLVQEHLKAAGFPEEEYKRPFEPQVQLFTQPRLASLLQWKDSDGVYMSSELLGDSVNVIFGSNFDKPQPFAGVDEAVMQLETTETYSVASGKLLSSNTYAVTESGQKVLLSSTNVHAQELRQEIPAEIQAVLGK